MVASASETVASASDMVGSLSDLFDSASLFRELAEHAPRIHVEMPSLGRIHNCSASQMPIAAAITISCVASCTLLLLSRSTRHGASADDRDGAGREAAVVSIRQHPPGPPATGPVRSAATVDL